MFRMRTVLQEFEAQLQPADRAYPNARGKAEWKRYGDQSLRLKVKASGLNLPEGPSLEITMDGQKIGEMVIEGNRARFERDSEKGEVVPAVHADQVIQVYFGSQLLLTGKFYAE